MASGIDEVSVDVAEGISAPEEEELPSPPPTEGDVSDMNEDDLPSSDDIRAAFKVATPLDTLPPGTSFLLQNPTPPLIVEPVVVSSDFIGDQLRNSIALSTKSIEVYNALTSALVFML